MDDRVEILDQDKEDAVVRAIPSIGEIPAAERKVIALKAYGLSNVAVAELVGVSEGTVRNIIKRYDPDHKLILSENLKKAFIAHNLLGLINEALGTIRPTDISGMSPKDRMIFAKTASGVLKDLEYTDEGVKKDVSDLMRSLENDTEREGGNTGLGAAGVSGSDQG